MPKPWKHLIESDFDVRKAEKAFVGNESSPAAWENLLRVARHNDQELVIKLPPIEYVVKDIIPGKFTRLVLDHGGTIALEYYLNERRFASFRGESRRPSPLYTLRRTN
jgi:hypothetical protein